MEVVGWRAFYTEGREFDSETTDWQDLPDDGVLDVVLFHDEVTDGGVRYRTTLGGHDWYFHVPGTDLFGSNSHPIEENRERYPDAVFKRGKWTTPTEMEWARESAQNAPLPE